MEQLGSLLVEEQIHISRNSRPNMQTVLSNRYILYPVRTDTSLWSRPTQWTLSSGSSPPDSGRWEAGVGTPQLPTSGYCSSTSKWLHLLSPTAPWSLLQAPLPAKSWRWRRQTEPESSPWVKEVERYSREFKRSEKVMFVCERESGYMATWCWLKWAIKLKVKRSTNFFKLTMRRIFTWIIPFADFFSAWCTGEGGTPPWQCQTSFI